MLIGLAISRIKGWNRGREHDRYRMVEDYVHRIVDGERLIVDLVSTGMPQTWFAPLSTSSRRTKSRKKTDLGARVVRTNFCVLAGDARQTPLSTDAKDHGGIRMRRSRGVCRPLDQ
jgi:hypothetical protein